MISELDYDKLREMIARCEWTFAKTMPFAPHEYIVKERCPLSAEEFEYFVNMQREHGIRERWGKYNNPYLYVDDYKYWTMGAPLEETTVINRAKACVVKDVHQLNEEISKMDKNFNIELINGRLKEIDECVTHLERIRNNYCCEIMQDWSNRLSADFPDYKKCEEIESGNVTYTGVTLPLENVPDSIAIRIQADKKSLIYGVTYMPSTKERRAELQEALGYINKEGDLIKGCDWLYYKYTSYKEGYDKLMQLIKKVAWQD